MGNERFCASVTLIENRRKWTNRIKNENKKIQKKKFRFSYRKRVYHKATSALDWIAIRRSAPVLGWNAITWITNEIELVRRKCAVNVVQIVTASPGDCTWTQICRRSFNWSTCPFVRGLLRTVSIRLDRTSGLVHEITMLIQRKHRYQARTGRCYRNAPFMADPSTHLWECEMFSL